MIYYIQISSVFRKSEKAYVSELKFSRWQQGIVRAGFIVLAWMARKRGGGYVLYKMRQ